MDQANYEPDVDLPRSEADPQGLWRSEGRQRVTGRLILYGITSTKGHCLWTRLPDSSAITMLHAKIAAMKVLANH